MGVYKAWRREVEHRALFERARARAGRMSTGQIVEQVDLALYGAAQAISRYRNSQGDRQDQLGEIRMNLEAALGMIEVITEEPLLA